MDMNRYFQELDQRFREDDIRGAEEVSLSYLNQASKEKDTGAVVAIANELGGLYRVQGRFDRALETYDIALRGIELLNLTGDKQHGITLLNLASVYNAAGNPDRALELYSRAGQIFEKPGCATAYELAALYNNISHIYEKKQDLSRALIYAERSLELVEDMEDAQVEKATSLTAIGSILTKMGRFEDALSNLLAAERIFEKLGGGNPHYAATLNNLGNLHIKLGDLYRAADYFLKSLELVDRTYGKSDAYGAVCSNLAEIYHMLGDEDKSVDYRKTAKEIEDRIRWQN